MADATRDLLDRIAELARRIPSAQMETICRIVATTPKDADLHGRLTTTGNAQIVSQLVDLIDNWRVLQPGVDSNALAWALRASARTAALWRQSENVDLVWTGPSAPVGELRRTEEAILEVIGGAKELLWLVCFASYRVPSVSSALVSAARRGVRIRMLLEEAEVSKGKVTHSALKGLGAEVARLASVYVWPLDKREKDEKGRHGSLHVKCLLADEDLLFVSSANLTEYAMSLNMELGLLVKGGTRPREVRQHLDWLLAQGYLLAISD